MVSEPKGYCVLMLLCTVLQGIALVGAVDCTDKEAAGNLCQRYGIRGFPGVKVRWGTAA